MFLARKRVSTYGLILALLMAFMPASTLADVTLVTPDSIVNDAATIIVVTGDTIGGGFVDGTSKILLDGVELPGTVFVSDTQLQVTVPAGVAP